MSNDSKSPDLEPGSGPAMQVNAAPVAAPVASPEPAPPGSAPEQTEDAAPKARGWLPVRSLSARQRPGIVDHLLALPERDRYLRFGFLASDEQVRSYVDRLDFDRDEVFGIHDDDLELIAVAHLAHPPTEGRDGGAAEFGVSVLPQARGRGCGARLFEQAMLHTRNAGMDTMYIHALSENAAMLHIARAAGATVVRDGSESEASLKLPPVTLSSRVEQWVEEGVGELDFQAKQVGTLIDAIARPKAPDTD